MGGGGEGETRGMQVHAGPVAEGLPQLRSAGRNRPAGPSGLGTREAWRRPRGKKCVPIAPHGDRDGDGGGVGGGEGGRGRPQAKGAWDARQVRALSAAGWMGGVSVAGCLVHPMVASAVEAGASVAAAASPPSSSHDLATMVSYLLSGAAGLLYTPQIVRLVRDPSAAAEVAPVTFVFKLLGYSLGVVYGQSRGLPLPVYLPDWVLLAQVSIINALLVSSSGVCQAPQGALALDRSTQIAAGSAAVALALAITGVWEVSPEEATAIPVINTVIFVSSLIPQFLRNMRTGTMGAYSPVVAGTAGAGTGARLASAAALTDDAPLLVALAVGVVMNSSLFFQILFYGTQRQGLTISEILLGDFIGEDGSAGDEEDASAAMAEEPCEVS